MTVASDKTLALMQTKVVDPFVPVKTLHTETGLSYGLSSCGYDIRILQRIVLQPGEFSLASSVEKFRMPNNLVGIVHDKSTLARMGIALQNTVIEPGWNGWLTLEITNHSKSTVTLEEGQPIAQVLFHYLDEPTTQPYNGKYQDQPNMPVEAIVNFLS